MTALVTALLLEIVAIHSTIESEERNNFSYLRHHQKFLLCKLVIVSRIAISQSKYIGDVKHVGRQIAEITDHLFLCGRGAITSDNLSVLGITHTLNVAVELKDFQYPPDLPIIHHHVLMRDTSNESLLTHLDDCFNIINNIRTCGGKVLIHCVAGVSRSASVCILYLIKFENMKLRDAYNHVLSRRDCIYPNSGFWRSMIEFEMEHRGDNSVEMRPYIFGWRPDVFPADLPFLLRGWIDNLMAFYTMQIFIFLLQIAWLCFS